MVDGGNLMSRTTDIKMSLGGQNTPSWRIRAPYSGSYDCEHWLVQRRHPESGLSHSVAGSKRNPPRYNHAAPRTPLESPWIARRTGVVQ